MKNDSQNIKEDEISLKQVVYTIQDYLREILKYWWIIILFIAPFLLRNLNKHYTTPELMSAEIKFIIEGDGGSGRSSIGGLLGSIGLGRPSSDNPYKILEVSKAKSTIGNVLLQKIEGDYIANRIIEKYNLTEAWNKNLPYLTDFRFTQDTLDNFTRKENLAFKMIYAKTIGMADPSMALLNITYDDELSMYNITAKSVDEGLSYTMAQLFYERIKYFFEEKVIEDKISISELLRVKRDSLSSLIGTKTLQVANFEDTSRGLFSSSAQYQKNKLILEIQGLTTAYTETWKNFEMADYDLRTSKPTFLKIDQSYLPLSGESPKLIFALITAFLLGGLLSVGFIVIRKLYRDIMSS